MTQFSKTTSIRASGVVGSGHPAVLNTWSVEDGLGVKPGQVLMKSAGVVTVWDGTTTITPDPDDGTVTLPQFAIATTEQLAGDTSVNVLEHGCYLFSRVTVGDSPVTTPQAELLSANGLFAENVW